MVLYISMYAGSVLGIPLGGGDTQTLLYAKELFEDFAQTGSMDAKTLGMHTCAISHTWA